MRNIVSPLTKKQSKAQIIKQVSILAFTAGYASMGFGMASDQTEQQNSSLLEDRMIMQERNIAYANSQIADLKKEFLKLKDAFNKKIATGILADLYVLDKKISEMRQEISFDLERFESTGRLNKKLQHKIIEKKGILKELCHQKNTIFKNPDLKIFVEEMNDRMKILSIHLTNATNDLSLFNIISEDISAGIQSLQNEINILKESFPISDPSALLPKEIIVKIMDFMSPKDYRSVACVSEDWNDAAEEFKGKFPLYVLDVVQHFVDAKTLQDISSVSLRWNHSTLRIKNKLPKSGYELIEKLEKKSFEKQLSFLTFCCQYQKNAVELFYDGFKSYFDLYEDKLLFDKTGLLTLNSESNLILLNNFIEKDGFYTVHNEITNIHLTNEEKEFNLSLSNLKKLIDIYQPYELCLMTAAFLGHQNAWWSDFTNIYECPMSRASMSGMRMSKFRENDNMEIMRNLLLSQNRPCIYEKFNFCCDGYGFSFLKTPGVSVIQSLINSKKFLNALPLMAVFELDKPRGKDSIMHVRDKIFFDSTASNLPFALRYSLQLDEDIGRMLSLQQSTIVLNQFETVLNQFYFIRNYECLFLKRPLNLTLNPVSYFMDQTILTIRGKVIEELINELENNPSDITKLEELKQQHKNLIILLTSKEVQFFNLHSMLDWYKNRFFELQNNPGNEDICRHLQSFINEINNILYHNVSSA